MSRFPCYFLAASLLSSAGTVHAQVSTGEEFKTKILAEWESLLETINTARWEMRIEYHSSRDPKNLRLTRVDVIQRAINRNTGRLWSGETEYFDEDMKTTTPRKEVHITNRRYAAELRTPKSGDGWVLTELKQDGKDVAARLEREVRCPWMRVGNMPLYQWLQDAGFVFTRIEQHPDQPTAGILRASFAYNPSQGQSSDIPMHIKSGYIDFDPAHSYRPMSYQFHNQSEHEEGILRGILEYDNGEGIPVLKVMTYEGESQTKRKGQIFGKEVHTYSNVKYNAGVRDEEFRLSHYGLPEPIGVTWEKPTRLYLWFLLAAGLCLALGMTVWYLGRRRLQVH